MIFLEEYSQLTCRDCGRIQESCCFKTTVPLSLEDVKQIESLGYRAEDFAEVLEYGEDELDGLENWERESLVEFCGKCYTLVFKHANDDNCIFLKKGRGCVLGEHRALACKIYPFWRRDSEIMFLDDFEESMKDVCMIRRNGAKVDEALKCICETRENIKEYHDRIIKAFTSEKLEYASVVKKILESKNPSPA